MYADNNQLTNLDVSKNTLLTNLRVYNNQLINLDVKIPTPAPINVHITTITIVTDNLYFISPLLYFKVL